MASIVLTAVSVAKGERRVLSLIDLVVNDGELIGLIGPSGSGKTTLLRVMASLEPEMSGMVLFDGMDVTGAGPADRNAAMVFQDNTLLPTLTARRNVAFPLEVAGDRSDEIERRVDAEARVLGIEALLERRPDEISLGHRQLVQVARAMVRVPDVFLFDEPLARMDAHLRVRARNELSVLQKGYGVTTVWATNDPAEAMAISDRIVVVKDGFIRGMGTPVDLYATPPNLFVALALGLPPMAVVDAEVFAQEPRRRIVFGSVELTSVGIPLEPGLVQVGIRPEDVERVSAGAATIVASCHFQGDHQMVTLDAAGSMFAMRDDSMTLRQGERVFIQVRRAHFFDPDTGTAIGHGTFE